MDETQEPQEPQEPRPLDVLLTLEDDELTEDEKTILAEYLDEQAVLKAEYERVNAEISRDIDDRAKVKQSEFDEIKGKCEFMYNESMEHETVETLKVIYE